MALDASGCEIVKIDSNLTGLSIAEEQCLKALPDTPTWIRLEPNSYSDFGGDLKTMARSPIDPSRQNKKGAVVDMDASGGFNIDKTRTNLLKLLQGFFFADAREPFSTKPLNGVQVPITAVDGATKTYTFAGAGALVAGQLIYAEGFANAANNGLKTVVSSVAGAVTVSETLVTEVPPAAAFLNRTGGALPAGDVSMAVTSGVASLVSTVTDFTTIPGLIPGAWIYIGGDAVGSAFVNNQGFARIGAVQTKALIFDEVTWTPANEAAAGAIRFFTGVVIRNEKTPSLIKRRSYSLERTLGEGELGTQAEYLDGAVANELTLNIPQGDKLNVDLTYVACENAYVTGKPGDTVRGGTRLPLDANAEAFNTSSDVYRMKMSVISPTNSNPASLFGYVTEASISINNSASPIKAVGYLGAVDITVGNFEVGGSLTALFTTVDAVQAIKSNADVAFNIMFARENSGFIFDIPLLGLGGGRLNVEKDNPITVPLTPAGAENKYGYTMQYQYFPYLPNLAMPQ